MATPKRARPLNGSDTALNRIGVHARSRSNPHLGEEGIATLALAMTGGRAEDRQTGWPDGTAIRYPMKDDALKKPGCSEVQLLAASLGVWFWAGKAQAHG